MVFDPDQRREAIEKFMAAHKLKVFPWTQRAGLAEATVRGFLAGRSRALSDETYEMLAAAATQIIARPVTAAMLRGEEPVIAEPAPRRSSRPDDAYEAEKRRQILQMFIARNRLKIATWSRASGVSDTLVRHFLEGRTASIADKAYAQLARGASQMLDRSIDPKALRGEPGQKFEIPIHHFIGAGDEVNLVDGDDGFDYTEAPPGYEEGGAGIVRGGSMLPIFDDGDVLFWRHLQAPPRQPPRRAVIVELADSRLFVKKLLPGSKKGYFHLVSINTATPTMIDEEVVRIARIGWVKPVE